MKRIAILVETSLASGRHILTGIASYVRERNDWSIYKQSGHLGAFEPDSIRNWKGDGIIARLASKEVLEAVESLKIPVVDVLGNMENTPHPVVRPDHARIGEMAAVHFLQKGFRSLAFYGAQYEQWSHMRCEAFLKCGEDVGASCHIKLDSDRRTRGAAWFRELGEWLKTLQRPTGLLIASDQYAPEVFEAAHQAGIKIPEELSIVGVDNDPPFCDLCNPPLSSIDPNHPKVGYEAARLLNEAIETGSMPRSDVAISPIQIFQRRSSSLNAVNDPALATAMHFISENACSGISVDEVARASGVSRSVLQRKFKSDLNRTVAESILDEKLRRAQELLRFTNHSITRVAELSGFNCQEYLNYIFRKHLKTTPRKVRTG
ncbi:MAG: XylR family transcriptional regulator [Opitutales bacterium]